MIDQERTFKFRYFCMDTTYLSSVGLLQLARVSDETRDMIAKFQRSQLSLIRSVIYFVRGKN